MDRRLRTSLQHQSTVRDACGRIQGALQERQDNRAELRLLQPQGTVSVLCGRARDLLPGRLHVQIVRRHLQQSTREPNLVGQDRVATEASSLAGVR